MEGFEITLDNGESMNVSAYLKYSKSSDRHKVFIWHEREDSLSISVQCASGQYDDIKISVTHDGILILSPHEIKVKSDEYGQYVNIDRNETCASFGDDIQML
jgi:hypothetical protein